MSAGFKVMLAALCGNATNVNLDDLSGQKITLFTLVDERLRMGFDSGRTVTIFDDGQSCCENRYMRTDDNLEEYIGSTFLGHELREGPEVDDGYGIHEQAFLVVKTDRGNVTFSNHNEHNGYYGGFVLVCVEDPS